MSEIDEALIQQIITLGEGNDVGAQKEACRLITVNFFPDDDCTNVSLLPQILPVLVKLMGSEQSSVQEKAIHYVIKITLTSSDEKSEQEFTRDVIRAGATAILLENLSSPETVIIVQSLKCFVNLACCFPKEIMANRDALPLLVRCLEATNEDIVYYAAKAMKNLSDCQQNIRAIIDAEVLWPLVNIIKSTSEELGVIPKVVNVLLNLVSFNVETCEYVLGYGVLKHVKRLLPCNPAVKLLVTEFFKIITSFNEKLVDALIVEGIVPLVLKNIRFSTNCDDVKMECVKTVMNILKFKPGYAQTLLDSGIVSVLYSTLRSSNTEFLFLVLSTLDNVIGAIPNDRENVEREFMRFRVLLKLKKLFNHQDKHVQDLSKRITYFFAGENNASSYVVSTNSDNTDVDGETTASEESGSEVDNQRPKRSRTIAFSESIDFSQPPAKKSKNDMQDDEDTFGEVEYCCPSEAFLKECCRTLDLKFNREMYGQLMSKINIDTISSSSLPSLQSGLNDKTGFGCLSVFLTGYKKDAQKIREKLRIKCIEMMNDPIDIKNVRGLLEPLIITPDYLYTFASWFHCRILVYSGAFGWERYGDWTSHDEPIPLLVMETDGDVFEIVLSVDDQ